MKIKGCLLKMMGTGNKLMKKIKRRAQMEKIKMKSSRLKRSKMLARISKSQRKKGRSEK